MIIINNIRLYSPAQGFERDETYHLKIEDGDIAGIEKGLFQGNANNIIDGDGKIVAPSFTDTHLHLLRYGLMKQDLDLRKLNSWEEVKNVLSDEREKKELTADDWIIARGLMDNHYDDIPGLAKATDLDEIEDERPMFILHKDGHECVVNTPALEEIQKNDDLHANHSAFIEKGPDGNWTGRFTDTAVHFIKFNFRSKNKDEIDKALRSALPILAENGITSVHPDDLNYAGTYYKVWQAYRDLEEEGVLTTRAFLHHYVFNIDDMKYFLENNKERTGDGTDKVRVGAFKIFMDGTHRLHTAAMHKPYHDNPDTRGTLIYDQNEIDKMLQLAEENNMQVAMHCLGDRAVETALGAIMQTDNSMRHRIIHAQTVSDHLLRLMEEVKPPVETQPSFLLGEWKEYAKWFGEKRGGYCGMCKSFSRAGVPFTVSSDSPIGPIEPFEHIFSAVNRTNHDGQPEGGWMPNEKLNVDEAFKRHVTTPAYLEFMDGQKGVLKKGAKADFIMLDDYPDNYADQDIHTIKVQKTWLDGEKIFDQSETDSSALS